MDVSKYRRLFLDESREHLQLLNRELLRLEREGEAFDGVDALFRSAHSVKGMSGSMGYDAMVAVSHALEDVLGRLRTKSLAATSGLMALLYEGVDALGTLANEIEELGATVSDVGPLAGRLRAAAQGEAPGSVEAGGVDAGTGGGIFALDPERLAQVLAHVRGGLVPYACLVRVAKDSAALAARGFVILTRLGRAGTLFASSPTLAEVRAGRGRELVEALLLTSRPEEQLRSELLSVPELRELQIRRLHVGPGAAAAAGGAPPAAVAPPEAAAAGAAATARVIAERAAARRAPTVRVDTRVLDDLIDIVGELIVTRERLREIARPLPSEELHAGIERLSALVRQFQESIMAVRMMPLDLVTDRLPRMVRDLAHGAGRQVGFEAAGRGIELDRAILEELGDVLVHLVRNAVDHGIEPPEERVAAGKPAKALVRVLAGRERDRVWIRVEDDGRGMDPERIARAAVERGLVAAETAAALGPREKLLLACIPGVSTAERVTGVSGRGVGMDVVKAKVDALGGTVAIDARPGLGTAITLRLPLTLAIVRVLLVDVRGQVFGLPVSHVLRAALLDPATVEGEGERSRVSWEARDLPLVDLARLLGRGAGTAEARAGGYVVIAESGDRAAALAVDRLLGTWEVVIKPLGPPLQRVRGLSGVAVMADGRIVVILDVPALL